MINHFTFNGYNSYSDMGMIITETPVFPSPERDVDFVSIPGRSGDIIKDNGRFKNITVPYKMAFWKDGTPLSTLINNIKAMLLSEAGYFKLCDTYHPGYFRYAAVSGSVSFARKMELIGSGTIRFNCKPFLYRDDGEEITSFTSAGTLENPEAFPSKPYIKITGSGNITMIVNNASFVFKDVEEYIEIDSEMMIAHKGTLSANVKMYTQNFPELLPGENSISWNGNVTSVEIKPRWCTV
ncbi:MAG: phage tail family protein [Clostridia bacterium]|nr:phage tail family protein [Clostridia bacterium]